MSSSPVYFSSNFTLQTFHPLFKLFKPLHLKISMEVLASDFLEDRQAAARWLSPTMLESLQPQPKHKLTTKISSLLKATGTQRASGAVFARLCFEDWSIIKSNGASWAVMMLHALELPDKVCWMPCINALASLYTKVHGKTELAREIAGSRIGEFMKRLLKRIEEVKCYDIVAQMLYLYPTQCRPYLNKLSTQLHDNTESCRRCKAYLCIPESQQTVHFTERFEKSIEAGDLGMVLEYVKVGSLIKANIPSKQIFELVFKQMSSLQADKTLDALDFVAASYKYMEPVYTQKFDALVFQLVECMDMGSAEAVSALKVMNLLLKSVGWLSKAYTSVFSSASKKTLQILETKMHATINASGLADFAQNRAAFVPTRLLSSETVAELVNFLVNVCIAAPQIPQSLRARIDMRVIELGSESEAVRIALYPGKYSVLPLVVNKQPVLAQGTESLIHPRLPPLTRSYMSYMREAAEAAEVEVEVEVEVEADEMDTSAADLGNAVEAEPVSEVNTSNATVTPAVTFTAVETFTETTTLVKKLDAVDLEPIKPVEPVEPEKIIVETESRLELPPAKKVKIDSDDEDSDFVMPSLSMDSD